MIYKSVTDAIIKNRTKRLNNEVISIPWSLKGLSRIIPGVEQARYSIISAGPKAGKSQLADFLYLYEPFEWVRENKDSPITLKILYFSLEMSRQTKILQAISYKLNKSYGISISPQNLKSTFESYILDERVLKIIKSKEFQNWLQDLESTVTFIDNLRSPGAIYNYVRKYAEKNGKFMNEGENLLYFPDNPNEYVIILTDHLSLLSPDHGTLFDAIYDYSAYKCLEFRDRFGYTVVNVQQQSAASGQQQFDYRGGSVVEKIRPTVEGLADCKLSARDCCLMISLFNPTGYNIEKYENIDLRKIGRWHRELYVNLNRNGLANAMVQLFFNGAVNEFAELPKTEDIYEFVERKTKYLIN